jgi:hypothetical protein
VAAEIGISPDFQVADALVFEGHHHDPQGMFETTYADERGDGLLLRLHEQTTGFGTRIAGRQIRTICLNLMNAEPAARLTLDWAGIPLISSSFADEAIGRLFVDLGPLGFGARIRNVNMEPLVRSLVDAAIMQRVAQSLG